MKRKTFLKHSAALAGTVATAGIWTGAAAAPAGGPSTVDTFAQAVPPNMLGAYGAWARELIGEGPAALSFRRPEFDKKSIGAWRDKARKRVLDTLSMPSPAGVPNAVVVRKVVFEGLDVELLRLTMPVGPPMEAVFLKPSGVSKRLPAVIGLHDHSGKKYFGHRKIARMSNEIHPLVKEHVDEAYGGLWWANELARRGYAVLVPDGFLFGSRRVLLNDVPRPISGLLADPPNPEDAQEIQAYNHWANQYENIASRSLFCAGTTMPGLVLHDDQVALNYLCSRPEVDPTRVGCCGLSSGGLRSLYLAGMDDRIAAAVCVGMMTTWRDFCFSKAYMHTWMIYPPGLPKDLDYPEILGLRVPLPTLVQNCREDQLFSFPEVERADRMLGEVFRKAGAENRYKCTFYPGGHRFDREMQTEAFAWLDSHLAG
ncbi:MAG: dienelactone hydrolase family protein [Bacteroidota bacterium]